jgi:phosphotriesterase-related protein
VHVVSVQTVRGPVESNELGVTLMHEHLWADFPAAIGGKDPLDSEPIVIEELGRFIEAGGRTIVELTVPDARRNPGALRRISEATGLHVVMGCGWYVEQAYPPEIDTTSTGELAARLISEIENGVGEERIRPGIIGEIGSRRETVSAQEERVFRAAARAALATGLTVTTHSIGRAGLEHLSILGDEGLDASRIIIGHSDYRLDPDYNRGVLEAGATVEFDWIGDNRATPEWDERLGAHIASLIRDGYREQLLVSTDVSRLSDLAILGGKSYGYLLDTFVPRLRRAGVTDADLEVLLVANPRRLLEPAG